jgi:hypothetical protein
VIGTTNRGSSLPDLEALVEQHEISVPEDVFNRFTRVYEVPSLKDRPAEVVPLLVSLIARRRHRDITTDIHFRITRSALQAITSHQLPGNVRSLVKLVNSLPEALMDSFFSGRSSDALSLQQLDALGVQSDNAVDDADDVFVFRLRYDRNVNPSCQRNDAPSLPEQPQCENDLRHHQESKTSELRADDRPVGIKLVWKWLNREENSRSMQNLKGQAKSYVNQENPPLFADNGCLSQVFESLYRLHSELLGPGVKDGLTLRYLQKVFDALNKVCWNPAGTPFYDWRNQLSGNSKFWDQLNDFHDRLRTGKRKPHDFQLVVFNLLCGEVVKRPHRSHKGPHSS